MTNRPPWQFTNFVFAATFFVGSTAAASGVCVAPTISAGRDHVVALANDGSVWAWGRNSTGKLGDGTSIDRWSPVRIAPPDSGFVKLSAGDQHTLAVKSDGSVWAWGGNNAGQLGDGSAEPRLLPTRIAAPGSGYAEVAAGGSHSLAVKSNGSVWAWGGNVYGQLGNTSTERSLVPAPVVGNLGIFVKVGANMHRSMAVRSDGRLWQWGLANKGAGASSCLNAIAYPCDTVPVEVVAIGKAVSAVSMKSTDAVARSMRYVSQNMSALATDGTLWTWGNTGMGELGFYPEAVPTQVTTGPLGFARLAVGADYLVDPGFLSNPDTQYLPAGHTVATGTDGSLWAWGSNRYGQIGNGSTVDQATPVRISPELGAPFYAVAAGQGFSLASQSDGTLWAWGSSIGVGAGVSPSQNAPARVFQVLPTKIFSSGFSAPVAAEGCSAVPTASLIVSATGATNVPIAGSASYGGTANYRVAPPVGTPVTLTAPVTFTGQTFSHWSGCDGAAGDTVAVSCGLVMPASGTKRVTAVYTNGASKLVNLSTRGQVLTGDKVMIVGFIISGGPKKVLVAARGPSLTSQGVAGALASTTMTLFSGSEPIASNTGWSTSADAAAIAASGKGPTDATESAILVTLKPGAYTVIIRGNSGATGIALVSVDDLDDFSALGRLINISARAPTSIGGDDQLIAGFILQGAPKNVLIKGAGPSMRQYGVPDILEDPSATLYVGPTPLVSNDNWGSSTEASAIDLQTTGSLLPSEAAIYRKLEPGAYTVILRGEQTPGIGLISVDE